MTAIEGGAFDAIATFSATSDEALTAARLLDEAWIRYFASAGPEPAREWIAEVEALQKRKELDLEAARVLLRRTTEAGQHTPGDQERSPQQADAVPPESAEAAEAAEAVLPEAVLPEAVPPEAVEAVPMVRTRKRRSRNMFLRTIGTPGQKALRLLLKVLVLLSGLLAGAGAISLALEVAGFLRLIDDPIQLPFGTQTVIFIVGVVAFIACTKMLRAVERALYGSKSVVASRLPL